LGWREFTSKQLTSGQIAEQISMAGESPCETTNYLGRLARSVKRFPLPALSAGFKSMARQGCCCVS
jgi:hypothetical protein